MKRSRSCPVCHEAFRRGWTRKPSLYGRLAVVPFGDHPALIFFRIGHDSIPTTSFPPPSTTLAEKLGLPRGWGSMLGLTTDARAAYRALGVTPPPDATDRFTSCTHRAWVFAVPTRGFESLLFFTLAKADSTLTVKLAKAAQQMVGWFWGREVNVNITDIGGVDTMYEASLGDMWRAPLAYQDDCFLCRKLTDAEVKRRLHGFTAAMQKEVARINRLPGKEGFPAFTDEHWNDRSVMERWEREADARYLEDPELLRDIRLLDLPEGLQRTLCVIWNHIWLDYLNELEKTEPYWTGVVRSLFECPPLERLEDMPSYTHQRWRWLFEKYLRPVSEAVLD